MKKMGFLILLLLAGCKKNEPLPLPSDPIVSPTTGSRFDMTKDSIFLYAKQLYLWNETLPSYTDFAPRSRYPGEASEISAFKQELFDITQLKTNPQTGRPFEYPIQSNTPKYSFITETGTAGGLMRASGTTIGKAVLHRAILPHHNRKIGYIVLDAFPTLKDSKAEYDEAFSFLSGQSIDELIIDLRTNNGGYVETAEYIANFLAPSHLKGKLMFSQVFNKQMQEGNATILGYQPYLDQNGKVVYYKGRPATMADVDYSTTANTKYFDPLGNMNDIRKISFITSVRTSSAAELLISIVKPYLDISIVGQPTYGKPVGSFGINIDKYSLFLPSFHLLNAEGWNGYFDGIPPTVTTPVDMYPSAWGNPSDSAIKEILEGEGIQNKSQNRVPSKISQKELIVRITDPIPMEPSGLTLKKE